MPGYANPQNLNRYSYVNNNPLRYTDPTGHMLDDGGSSGGGGNPNAGNYCITHPSACNGGGSGGNNNHNNNNNDNSNNGGGGGKPLLEIANTESFYCGNGPNGLYNFLDCAANVTQDLALLIDTPFAIAEYYLTVLACMGSACGLGVALSDAAFNATGANAAETILSSGLSTIFSIGADRAEDGQFGDDTKSAVVLALLGVFSPDPLLDFAVDGVGAGLNHDVNPINKIPMIPNLIHSLFHP